MREWSIIIINDNPSNPQQPIHSLRSAPVSWVMSSVYFKIFRLLESWGFHCSTFRASGEWQKNVAHGLGNYVHHAKGQVWHAGPFGLTEQHGDSLVFFWNIWHMENVWYIGTDWASQIENADGSWEMECEPGFQEMFNDSTSLDWWLDIFSGFLRNCAEHSKKFARQFWKDSDTTFLFPHLPGEGC